MLLYKKLLLMTFGTTLVYHLSFDPLIWLFFHIVVVLIGMLSCFAGHLDSQSSIRYVLLATSFISLAFTVTQGVLEMVSPDEIFHVNSKDYDLFGHGGMLFWFVSSVVFTVVRK